ncbi:hypothetical protein EVAR_30431_1 [Eumeta japonica]|uniref:Uncharacterized protein n=1 Tax=Eumeta variegata TaxID=151549 RepID=A0A4C1W5V6_EUMVA|nr:hypothetical protein EVAR_30431_1 [Eumeta japonica]
MSVICQWGLLPCGAVLKPDCKCPLPVDSGQVLGDTSDFLAHSSSDCPTSSRRVKLTTAVYRPGQRLSRLLRFAVRLAGDG